MDDFNLHHPLWIRLLYPYRYRVSDRLLKDIRNVNTELALFINTVTREAQRGEYIKRIIIDLIFISNSLLRQLTSYQITRELK